MATSVTPSPSPNSTASATRAPYEGASAGPSSTRPEKGPPIQQTRRLEYRSTSGPATSIDTSAPPEISSRTPLSRAGPR